MAGDAESEVPEGAAVFPLIPPELGVNPLLLAALHATVFLSGSDDTLVDATAADEAVQRIADYFQRLNGPALDHVREDLDCLTAHARQQQWPTAMVEFLQSCLADLGVEDGKQ